MIALRGETEERNLSLRGGIMAWRLEVCHFKTVQVDDSRLSLGMAFFVSPFSFLFFFVCSLFFPLLVHSLHLSLVFVFICCNSVQRSKIFFYVLLR